MQIDTVKAAYRRYAGFYDALFGPVLQPGRKAVHRSPEVRPGDRVLEVGVGTGLSLALYPAGVRVTGIDVSREMLDKARRAAMAKRKLQNVEALLEMDAEAMSFADASFDKVVAMYVVPVVRTRRALLEELHRVCKPTARSSSSTSAFRQPGDRRRGEGPGALLRQDRLPGRTSSCATAERVAARSASRAREYLLESDALRNGVASRKL